MKRSLLPALGFATVLAGLTATGCGAHSGASCDRPAAGLCLEWHGVTASEAQLLKSTCESEGGTWAAQACPRDQAYLGCTTMQGMMTETQWSTVPVTAAQEKAACPSPGMVVVGGKTAPDGGLGSGGAGGSGTGGRGTGGFGTGGFGTGGLGTGGAAGCAACTVTAIAVDANHLVFDPVHQRLYATVGGGAATYPNTVAIIDPATAVVASSVSVGSNPNNLALSDDGSTLWIGLDGAAAVRSLDLTVSPPSVGTMHPLPTPSSALSSIMVGPMVVLPGAPQSLAVNTLYNGISPPYVGTYILDNGVARPTPVTTFAGPALLTSGPSPYLFGFNNEDTGFDFFTLTVTASGATAKSTTGLLSGFNNAIVYGYGRVLAGSGDVLDVSTPTAPTRAGRFDFTGAITPRGANQAVMVSPPTGVTGSTATLLRVLDLTTFTQTASVALPQITSSTATDLQVVAPDAVAFIGNSSTSAHQIYIVHATVLASTP